MNEVIKKLVREYFLAEELNRKVLFLASDCVVFSSTRHIEKRLEKKLFLNRNSLTLNGELSCVEFDFFMNCAFKVEM